MHVVCSGGGGEHTRYFLQQIKYGFGGLLLLPAHVALLTLGVLPSLQSTVVLPFRLVRTTGRLTSWFLLLIGP